jgi:flavodoxin I
MAYLQDYAKDLDVTKQRAEEATPNDLMNADYVLLGSGTWNTGGIEGQLNTHMVDFLTKRAKGVDLTGKKIGIIALGDDRYFYTSRAGEHLRSFIKLHGGDVLGDALTVVNEPYGQEERVHKWAEKLLTWVQS